MSGFCFLVFDSGLVLMGFDMISAICAGNANEVQPGLEIRSKFSALLTVPHDRSPRTHNSMALLDRAVAG